MMMGQKKSRVRGNGHDSGAKKCNSYYTYILQQIQNDCKGGLLRWL